MKAITSIVPVTLQNETQIQQKPVCKNLEF